MADVLEIADYLGCSGGKLWAEVSRLLKRQHDYAQLQLVTQLEGHKHTAGVIDYKTGLRLDVDWIEAGVLEHKKQELEGGSNGRI